MSNTSPSTSKKSRFRPLIILTAVALPLIIFFICVILNTNSEALSPDEIMAKQKWSDEELKNALARSMSPAVAGQRKKEIVRHLSAQLKKRSPEDQEKIRIGAVVASVTASLDQVRKMPENERSKMLNTISARAEKNYAVIHKNAQKRKEFEQQLKSKEMEAFTNEVNRVIFSELTPNERVQFAPVTKIWIKTMKSMGH